MKSLIFNQYSNTLTNWLQPESQEEYSDDSDDSDDDYQPSDEKSNEAAIIDGDSDDDSNDDYQPDSSALESGSDSDEEADLAAIIDNMHGQKESRALSNILAIGESSDNEGKLQSCVMR